MNEITVALYLMTEKGRYSLQKVLENGRKINYVVISDKQNNDESKAMEIRELCRVYNIPCFDRRNSPNIKGGYIIAIGWKWMIESKNVIVFHDSILPKYRGFNPLPTALINGDSEIGVTALLASEKYDSGDIINQRKIGIKYPIKIYEAIEKIKVLYAEMLDQILEFLTQDLELPSTPQNDLEATYSLWRDEEDYKIDWNQSSELIKRKIDAVGFPYKGASTTLDDRVYRIFDAELVDDVKIENRTPGKVIFKEGLFPVIVCGEGLLRLLNLFNEDSINVVSNIKFRSRFK